MIAEQIKHARLQAGLSQRELSRRVNLPQSYLSKIEAGKLDIGSHNLQVIAEALGMVPMLVAKKYLPTLQALMQDKDLSTALWQIDDDAEDDHE